MFSNYLNPIKVFLFTAVLALSLQCGAVTGQAAQLPSVRIAAEEALAVRPDTETGALRVSAGPAEAAEAEESAADAQTEEDAAKAKIMHDLMYAFIGIFTFGVALFFLRKTR